MQSKVKNGAIKNNFKSLRQGLDCLEGDQFLLTEFEFQLIKEHYMKIKKEINDLLVPSFAEESLRLSNLISDHSGILQAIAKCTALLATQKTSND